VNGLTPLSYPESLVCPNQGVFGLFSSSFNQLSTGLICLDSHKNPSPPFPCRSSQAHPVFLRAENFDSSPLVSRNETYKKASPISFNSYPPPDNQQNHNFLHFRFFLPFPFHFLSGVPASPFYTPTRPIIVPQFENLRESCLFFFRPFRMNCRKYRTYSPSPLPFFFFLSSPLHGSPEAFWPNLLFFTTCGSDREWIVRSIDPVYPRTQPSGRPTPHKVRAPSPLSEQDASSRIESFSPANTSQDLQ